MINEQVLDKFVDKVSLWFDDREFKHDRVFIRQQIIDQLEAGTKDFKVYPIPPVPFTFGE